MLRYDVIEDRVKRMSKFVRPGTLAHRDKSEEVFCKYAHVAHEAKEGYLMTYRNFRLNYYPFDFCTQFSKKQFEVWYDLHYPNPLSER